jgi:acid phosphatase family membrane protein YuiD
MANITDAAGVKLGSGIAAARLINRLLGSVSEALSDAQKRQVAQLLLEENPDVVARALKDSAGYDELTKLAEALSKRIRAAGQVGGAQAGSRQTEDFTGLLGN